MPVDNVARLQASLEHIPSTLVRFGERDGLATVILFGMKRDAEILMRAARSAYLTVAELPDEYQGTPAEVLEALEEVSQGHANTSCRWRRRCTICTRHGSGGCATYTGACRRA